MCAMIFDRRAEEQEHQLELEREGARERARGVIPPTEEHEFFRPDGQAELAPQPTEMIRGKTIVCSSNGEVIGKVSDVLIVPESLRVAALVINKGNFFNREIEYIPAEAVEVWGENVIMVQDPDVAVRPENLGNTENWLSVADKLKGRYVVSRDGKRIGLIGDVLIDTRGQIAEYDLGQVYVDGPLAQSKRIPVEATHTLGRDVMIVDMNKVTF